MTPFEFLFGLFGLLLGLCIAEIFGGLGRTFESRNRITTGWLTPLLGVFVLLDLITWWFGLWVERASLTMSLLSLFAGAAFAGAYYLAAYIVFPREMAAGVNLDEHFFAVRRLVLAISIIAFIGGLVIDLVSADGMSRVEVALTTALFSPGYALAFLAKKKRLAMVGLILLNVMTMVGAVSQVVFPHQS